MISLQLYLIFISVFLGVYLTSSYVQTIVARRKLPGIETCRPIRKYPQQDDKLGIKWVKSQWKAYKNQAFLEAAYHRFEEFGDTYQAYRIGNTFIQTRDAENVKAILSTNFQDFSLGPRLVQMGPFLGRGIFTTDGKAWEHSRALVRPNFARMQVRNLDTLERHVRLLVDKIPRDGSIVDLQELFFQLTLDSGTELLFGESVDTLQDNSEHSEHHEFVEAYDFCQARVLLRPRIALLAFLRRDREFEQKCKIVHKYVDRYVSKVLQGKLDEKQSAADTASDNPKDKRYVFLEELAKETTDRTTLRDEVLNVLLAGRDTTASLLSNTFHVLARRPDIWQELREEVDQLQGAQPTYEQLRDMRYVRYLLNESLRLYPVVPMNQRFAVRDTILPRGGGEDGLSPILVKKGQAISYHVYSMHRRKDIFGDDADQFSPQRWTTLRAGWAYLPFNGGPRICPGQQFALTEASYTLVRMVQEFDAVEAEDMQPWKELLGMTTASYHGTRVKLQPKRV